MDGKRKMTKYMEDMMKLYKLVAIFVLLMAGAVSAQVGRTGVPFLLIAPGARAAGMGEAFIAIADDATAVHWNPAGLGRYPLTGTWMSLATSPGDTLTSLVLIKNNLPEANYQQYDLWGIVDRRLAKWDGVKWVSGIKRDLKAGASLTSAIGSFTGLSDQAAEPYVDRLARANNPLPKESIDSLQTRLMAAVPENYTYKDDLQAGFKKLTDGWLSLRIDLKGFTEIRNDINNILADSVISTDKLDKISFGFNRAIEQKGDRNIYLPYDLSLPDTINCLGSDEDYLFVGTNHGLYRMDPDKLKWSSYTTKTDSLPSDFITSIQKVGKHTMYIGTDKGLTTFTGREIKPFPAGANAPTAMITVIGALDDRNAWAASNSDLYHYDGFKWQNAQTRELSGGETVSKAVQSFYGEMGAVHANSILAEVLQNNPGITDTAKAGQTINMPYRFAYKGNVTAMGVDDKDRLWVGTTTGINYFDGISFHLYGYKVYEAPKATTIQEIAKQFIPDRDSTKINKLAALIKDYNSLDPDSVQAGTKLLVYSNALGSEVDAICPVSSKKAIVATDQGIVEYDNNKWSRFHGGDIEGSKVSGVYSRSGEMWVGDRDRVSVYSAAKKQITFMHSNYLVALANDLYYEYFSFVLPTSSWGTFGMGITFLSLGKQARTDENAQDLGFFYTYEMAFTLSYGTKLMHNVYGGMSLRYINSHLSDVGAGKEKGSGVGYSVAVDGGVIYDMSRRLTLAATVTNIGPNISYIDANQSDPLPRKLAVGYVYRLVDNPYNKLSFIGEATKLLVDLNHSVKTEVQEIIPHVGLEYWYSNYIAGRVGYVYDKVGVQRYVTLGLSLQYSNYRFDFSYIPTTNENYNRLGNTIRFSMNAGF
jgi:hypothetical protein